MGDKKIVHMVELTKDWSKMTEQEKSDFVDAFADKLYPDDAQAERPETD